MLHDPIFAAPVDEIRAQDAWNLLRGTPGAVLIDVRSRPEWSFCGMPDLSDIGRDLVCVEWQTWPNMTPNLGFLADLRDQTGPHISPHLVFLCRIGGRARSAAREVARQLAERGLMTRITVVAGGFEGEMNADGQRGTVNGWKAEGLPWRQT